MDEELVLYRFQFTISLFSQLYFYEIVDQFPVDSYISLHFYYTV